MVPSLSFCPPWLGLGAHTRVQEGDLLKLLVAYPFLLCSALYRRGLLLKVGQKKYEEANICWQHPINYIFSALKLIKYNETYYNVVVYNQLGALDGLSMINSVTIKA